MTSGDTVNRGTFGTVSSATRTPYSTQTTVNVDLMLVPGLNTNVNV